MIKRIFLTLIWLGASFSQHSLFAQKKNIINYDYETNSLDQDYLYYQQNFILKGPAKFYDTKFDSVRVYIFKTQVNDKYEKEKILTLSKDIPVKSTFQLKRKKNRYREKKIIQKNGLYYFEKTYADQKDKNNNIYVPKKVEILTNREIKKYEGKIWENATYQYNFYTNSWKRKDPSQETFEIAITEELLYNWMYFVQFKFYSTTINTLTVTTSTNTSTTAATSSITATVAITGGIQETLTVTSPISGGQSVTTTIRTKIVKEETRNEMHYRAYDEETVHSHFSVTTGFGGMYLANFKNAPKDVEYLNFIGVRYHFKRIFPANSNPYFLHGSKWSFGMGAITTTLKYREKALSGFGSSNTIKPVISLGYDFGKYFGLSFGIVGFKQASPITATSQRNFAIAPFVTLNLSAEVIGLLSTKNPPEANKP